ncbi:MAG: 3-deoxy-7-phosphoheptulonate synthase [Bryobacteraceae bacterium]|nr:3-deoxy-7-phosphoheptulonate synthase [Bryobacteraceae bacterium]
MLVVMEHGATERQIENVIERLVTLGFTVHRSTGVVHTILGGVGPVEDWEPADFEAMEGVKECHRIVSPYQLAARYARAQGTQVRAGEAVFGGGTPVIAAAVSSDDPGVIAEGARRMKAAGAKVLRVRAAYRKSLPHASAAAREQGLTLSIPWGQPGDLGSGIAEISDISNTAFWKEAGSRPGPVLLERPAGGTVEDLLIAAERVLVAGNSQVILCEAGSRGAQNSGRRTLDLVCVPLLARLTHLPVVVDCSSGTGRRDFAAPLAQAATAAGAAGIFVDIHPDPDRAARLSGQSLSFEAFERMAARIFALAACLR